jgi:hypothetical protein
MGYLSRDGISTSDVVMLTLYGLVSERAATRQCHPGMISGFNFDRVPGARYSKNPTSGCLTIN